MKNSKSLVAAIVLASASFASSSVLAQDLGSTQGLNLTDNSAFFGDTFEMDNSGSMFTDRFTFSVNEAIPQTFDAIVSSISNTASMGLDITGLDLYDTSDTLLTSGTSVSSGRIDVWTLTNANLENGDYYVQVTGEMVSSTAGSFGGAVMLAPVPEPETYGMLLGGLGILAFLARGRKAKQS